MQALVDLYGGYIYRQQRGVARYFQGAAPRQYINQTSIKRGEVLKGVVGPADHMYTFSVLDPFDDLVATLDEICLRYALKAIPSSPTRVAELEEYLQDVAETISGANDSRVEVSQLMSTTFSKSQVAHNVTEQCTVTVYRAQYAYTAVAMGLTYLTGLLVLFLLQRVLSTHGKKFTMSPLEIAKAFGSPLLSNIYSTLSGDGIAKTSSSAVKVKYGEVRQRQRPGECAADDAASLVPRPDESTTMGLAPTSESLHGRDEAGETDTLVSANAENPMRKPHGEYPSLGIDAFDEVATPVDRKIYL